MSRCWVYENTKTSTDSAYGVNVYLWEFDGKMAGMFIYECGSIGKPLRVLVQPIHYDAKNQKVSFSVPWSHGKIYESAKRRWSPMQQKLEFSGILTEIGLKGKLKGESCGAFPNQGVVIKEMKDCAEAIQESGNFKRMKAKKKTQALSHEVD